MAVRTIFSMAGVRARGGREDLRRIAQDWQEAVQAFQALRGKYLIYPK